MLDRNLESQKEKLETDLKREIKKLQKNRELIKNWQLNDTIDVLVSRSKLSEYRKLVEEAMEKYKEVEKLSKMKTFSNQSIMMASLEQEDLSPECIDTIEFLETCKESLQEQIESLDQEYERISSRKTKKNSSLELEKQEIEAFLAVDKFHLGKFEEIIEYLKTKQINPDLVDKIKDDISFIVESNQDPDFVDDETLYDEIYLQAESNYRYKPEETTIEEILETNDDESSPKETKETKETKDTKENKEKEKEEVKERDERIFTTPKKDKDPEFSSPDIIHKLKPASPGKNVEWSSLAARFSQPSPPPTSIDEPPKTSPKQFAKQLSEEPKEMTPENDTGSEVANNVEEVPLDAKQSALVDHIKSANLPEWETKICTNFKLTKMPPGLQHFTLSVAASQSAEPGLVLVPLGDCSTAKTSVQSSVHKSHVPGNLKPPLNISVFSNNWNRLRASGEFDEFQQQVNAGTDETMVNNLLFTLFYGFYYGVTPLENLIAESTLNNLGWFSYSLKVGEKYSYWFRKIGDSYQIFDITTWDISAKYGYKLDFNVLELQPLRII